MTEQPANEQLGDFLDFQRCERPDGTFYGIRDGYICRKGRPVGPRVVEPKAPRKPRVPNPKALATKASRARKAKTSVPKSSAKPIAPTRPLALKGDVQTIRSSLTTAERMARAVDRGDLRPGGAKKPGPKVKKQAEASKKSVAKPEKTKAEVKKTERRARLSREKELKAQEKAARDREREAAKADRQKRIEEAKKTKAKPAKKPNPMEALKAQMAAEAAKFEREEAARAEEKPKLDRSELTTRRRELRARVERELKADIEKQSQDPGMRDYLNSLSPGVKQAREQLELRRRIRERMKEEKLVPDEDQIREAQRKLSKKDFAPENGRIKIVALNGKQNTETENQLNAGLARTRATSKDAEKKIDELMKALEHNPIAIGAYDKDPSGGDAKLAQRSNIRGKLTRAGANAEVIERAIARKISSNSMELGWAMMTQNTIMLSNAKEVKKLNTPKEAAQLMRFAQKGQAGAHWSWTGSSVDGIFIHEVGHIMHQRAFKGMSREDMRKETEKQFKERGVRANSKYGTTNTFETVAELYASYVMYGNQMKREMPETYAWIDEMAKRAYAAD